MMYRESNMENNPKLVFIFPFICGAQSVPEKSPPLPSAPEKQWLSSQRDLLSSYSTWLDLGKYPIQASEAWPQKEVMDYTVYNVQEEPAWPTILSWLSHSIHPSSLTNQSAMCLRRTSTHRWRSSNQSQWMEQKQRVSKGPVHQHLHMCVHAASTYSKPIFTWPVPADTDACVCSDTICPWILKPGHSFGFMKVLRSSKNLGCCCFYMLLCNNCMLNGTIHWHHLDPSFCGHAPCSSSHRLDLLGWGSRDTNDSYS